MGMVERVDAAIDAALVSRIVGCVVLVNVDGKPVYARAAGLADREASMPMQLDTIFRLASVTKPIVATAVLRMRDLGLLDLDDPVTRFLPWFTPPSPDGTQTDITLRQLLSHTSGLSYGHVPPDVSPGLSGPILSLEENLRRLAKAPLVFAPGTGWEYGMSIDVLGGVVAAINNSTLEAALDKYVTGPLGMVDTHFHVTDTTRLAPPYADGRPPVRMGELHVVNHPADGSTTTFSAARIFQSDAFQSGGAGAAGTAPDVLKLLEIYNGVGTLLAPATIAEAIRNQIGTLPRRPQDAGKRFNLIGAVIDDPKAAASPCPVGTVDWGGVWGHNWIVDPVNRITVVVCTNTTPEGCNGPFREDIRDAVYG